MLVKSHFSFVFQLKHIIKFIFNILAIGVVALDTRLGCLDPKIESNAETLLKAVTTFNDAITALEFHIPFWKFFNTPTWKQLVHSLDTFRE